MADFVLSTKFELDVNKALSEITKIEQRIKALEHGTINLNVNSNKTISELEKTEKKLKEIGNNHLQINLDSSKALQELTNFEKKMSEIEGKSKINLGIKQPSGASTTGQGSSSFLNNFESAGNKLTDGMTNAMSGFEGINLGMVGLGVGIFAAYKAFEAIINVVEKVASAMAKVAEKAITLADHYQVQENAMKSTMNVFFGEQLDKGKYSQGQINNVSENVMNSLMNTANKMGISFSSAEKTFQGIGLVMRKQGGRSVDDALAFTEKVAKAMPTLAAESGSTSAVIAREMASVLQGKLTMQMPLARDIKSIAGAESVKDWGKMDFDKRFAIVDQVMDKVSKRAVLNTNTIDGQNTIMWNHFLQLSHDTFGGVEQKLVDVFSQFNQWLGGGSAEQYARDFADTVETVGRNFLGSTQNILKSMGYMDKNSTSLEDTFSGLAKAAIDAAAEIGKLVNGILALVNIVSSVGHFLSAPFRWDRANDVEFIKEGIAKGDVNPVTMQSSNLYKYKLAGLEGTDELKKIREDFLAPMQKASTTSAKGSVSPLSLAPSGLDPSQLSLLTPNKMTASMAAAQQAALDNVKNTNLDAIMAQREKAPVPQSIINQHNNITVQLESDIPPDIIAEKVADGMRNSAMYGRQYPNSPAHMGY